MASGDPRLSGKTVAVNDGAYNGVTKTQSLSRAASNYVTTPVGAYYVPANYTAINHISTDTSFVWYPTYLSRVTVPSGAGGPPQGSQFTGFIHDIEIGGQAQDCSAVFHSVYMHGQTASEEAETTGFYYNHQIGNSNPNDSLGKYYSSIIEGQQIFDNVGSGTRNGLGWWHLLWVRDSAVANLPSYAFITALNGLDTSTWAPLAGYATFYADRFLSCLGNWKAIFSAGPVSNFKLNVSTVGIDLHTNTMWTPNIAALKISRDTVIDFRGEDQGTYYIRAEPATDQLSIIAGGAYAALFTSTTAYFPGTLSKGAGGFKITHPLDATKWLVHSFVEAPTADLMYRGEVSLVDGGALVNIDSSAGMTSGTFVALTKNCQIFVQNKSGWTQVRGSVAGNVLTIEAQESCNDNVDWLVIATRADDFIKSSPLTDDNGDVIVELAKDE